jgi:uncharacterized membrane protein
MINKEISVFINRPAQEVFDYLAALERAGEWQKDVVRSEIHGPLAVGTTGVFVQKFMGREIANEYRITSYSPPHEICFETTSGPVSFVGCQRCEEQDGGTLATIVVEAEVGGFFSVAEGMVGKQLESALQGDFDNLKSILEG